MSKVIPTKFPWSKLFALLWGLFLGLALVKFGNPVILDHLVAQSADWQGNPLLKLTQSAAVSQPENAAPDLAERFFEPWSMYRAFYLFIPLAVLGLFLIRKFDLGHGKWVVLPLGIWFFWQFIASIGTVNVNLTRNTMLHFSVCCACFLLARLLLRKPHEFLWIWPGVLLGLTLVFWRGFNQHYGGLEALQRFIYEQPNWQSLPPELLQRIQKQRVFSTLVYPNALAGVILLLVPAALVSLWRLTLPMPKILSEVLVGLFAYCSLACLYWSGSKAGWLIVIMLLFLLIHRLLPVKKLKWALSILMLVGGLTGFIVKFSAYFQKGATSVSARMDYWRAAWVTGLANPICGTGPGTFSVPYQKIKAPESEMARLVHNDYLEQFTDSGLVGFFSYLGFIFAAMITLYRKLKANPEALWQAAWLGLFGWVCQSAVEFGLYIPAIAWPAFTLLGATLGAVSLEGQSEVDTTNQS